MLDALGGTGRVSYKLRQEGKQVFYNDIPKFNSIIGTALIENSGVKPSDHDMSMILRPSGSIKYPSFISDTFRDIYYTDEAITNPAL